MTEWESVGAYRRALGGFDVKVHATPLLAESLDEPSAFETLATAATGRSGHRPDQRSQSAAVPVAAGD